jgi:hypothetical protein
VRQSSTVMMKKFRQFFCRHVLNRPHNLVNPRPFLLIDTPLLDDADRKD